MKKKSCCAPVCRYATTVICAWPVRPSCVAVTSEVCAVAAVNAGMSSVEAGHRADRRVHDRPRCGRADVVGRAVGVRGHRGEALRALGIQVELHERVRRRHEDRRQSVRQGRRVDRGVLAAAGAVQRARRCQCGSVVAGRPSARGECDDDRCASGQQVGLREPHHAGQSGLSSSCSRDRAGTDRMRRPCHQRRRRPVRCRPWGGPGRRHAGALSDRGRGCRRPSLSLRTHGAECRPSEPATAVGRDGACTSARSSGCFSLERGVACPSPTLAADSAA